MQMNEIQKLEENLEHIINYEENKISCIDQKYKNLDK